MPEYLIRCVQQHESFRKAELESLATLAGVEMNFISYSESVRSLFLLLSCHRLFSLSSSHDNFTFYTSLFSFLSVYSLFVPKRKILPTLFQSSKHPEIFSQGPHKQEAQISPFHIQTPFALVTLPSDAAARAVITRSILSMGIYELWGSGADYPALHASVAERTAPRWPAYATTPFRFSVDAFQGKRSSGAQRGLIDSFRYMAFGGPIRMKDADLHLCIFEEYEQFADVPKRVFLGRWVADGGRRAVVTYDLKKRRYISTTSMDAELALVTANMALAAPGKCFFDPFVGTGSFTVAVSHFGAQALGSDIDGRSIRGKGKGKGVVANFKQYGLTGRFMDNFVSDLTNTPLRRGRWLDGIVCDPPYGVREGLKVLGRKDGGGQEAVMIDGEWAHL